MTEEVDEGQALVDEWAEICQEYNALYVRLEEAAARAREEGRAPAGPQGRGRSHRPRRPGRHGDHSDQGIDPFPSAVENPITQQPP